MKNCLPHIQEVLVGVTYTKALLASAISAAIAFGLAWYIKGRGMAGVQVDLNNIKTDVEGLKNKFGETVAQPAPTV